MIRPCFKKKLSLNELPYFLIHLHQCVSACSKLTLITAVCAFIISFLIFLTLLFLNHSFFPVFLKLSWPFSHTSSCTRQQFTKSSPLLSTQPPTRRMLEELKKWYSAAPIWGIPWQGSCWSFQITEFPSSW